MIKADETMGKFKMGEIIGERWKIVQKLDQGGFGSVYKVQNTKDPKSLAALKVEGANSDESNHLKLETAVLKAMHDDGIRAHVPQLFRSAKRRTYCYMIITLLGENLKKLKDRHFPNGMPLRTWSRIGVQCLYGIKTMHDRGFVHRDIKAQNFVLGYSGTPRYARVVYIIDFGLSRAYAFPPTKKNPKWIARRERARLDFRGTYRFASPSMHEEKEQGRKDDIWSFLYLMIDLYCGLPWSEKDTKVSLEKKKLLMKDEDLMIRMPEETKFIPKHLRTLDVYQRPDYVKIYLAFEALRKKTKTSYDDFYEWESRDLQEINKKAMTDKAAPIGYTTAEIFFQSDPILIGTAPSPEDEKELNERFVVKKTKKPEMISLEDVLGISASNAKTNKNKKNKSKSKSNETVSNKSSKQKTSKSTVSNRSGGRSAKGKRGKKDRSSEESSDFVPSCYMNLDIPLHYLQTPNSDTKDFQKRVVSMDWGHAEPAKQQFKEVYSPGAAAATPQQQQQELPAAAAAAAAELQPMQQQQQPQPQETSSGANTPQDPAPSCGPVKTSDQLSIAMLAPQADFSVSHAINPPSPVAGSPVAMSPTCKLACMGIDYKKTGDAASTGMDKEIMSSSNSQRSVSLVRPGSKYPSRNPPNT